MYPESNKLVDNLVQDLTDLPILHVGEFNCLSLWDFCIILKLGFENKFMEIIWNNFKLFKLKHCSPTCRDTLNYGLWIVDMETFAS